MSDELNTDPNIRDRQSPVGDLLLYPTEDGQSRVECRFENEPLWVSQGLMGELFDRDVRDPLLPKLISGERTITKIESSLSGVEP